MTMDDDFSLKSKEEMIKSFKDTPEAIENTQEIVSRCNLEIELGKTELPYFSLPKGFVLSQQMQFGIAQQDVPIYERFYAGGG